MKLTKIKIEECVGKIEAFLEKHNLLGDVCIYYNNKRRAWRYDYYTGTYVVREADDIDPHDYFQYAAYDHIISMSFEGALYDVLNGYSSGTLVDKFQNVFEEYGLYYELGNSWNLTCCENSNDMEVEYTVYERPMETVMIYSHSTNAPSVLLGIKHKWDTLSATTVHLGGSCTIGDGFKFKYEGIPYKMTTPNYQGSCIYEHWIDTIKEDLKNIGATDIYYDYGMMD